MEWTHCPHSPVLADVFVETGGMIPRDEIACVCADSLFILRYASGSLVKLDSVAVVSSSDELKYAWIASSEIDGENGDDLIVATHYFQSGSPASAIDLYSSDSTGVFYSSRCWSGEIFNSIPAIGDLGSGNLIAISKYKVNSYSPNPADLLDPSDLTTAASCTTSSTTQSNYVLCCIMADWAIGTGVDRVIAPAENQCFVFDDDGYEDWFTTYSDTTGGYRPPFPALGDLEDDGVADLLIGVRKGFVSAYDEGGYELSGSGFPFHLPSEVHGGFLIADIDNDAKVEVVFGTMDNYLHVWEFDDCDSSYAPWPQIQHDAMRSGVLE
jgi:hypothetical protein